MKIKCQNCQSNKIETTYTCNEFNVLKCSDCLFYFKDIGEDNYEILNSDYYLNFNFNRLNEAKEINKIIQKHFKSAKILEIGSGTGSLLNALNQLGNDVIGIEPNKAAVEISRSIFNNVKVINSYFKYDLVENNFNVILLYDVIEHLKPTNILFSEIYKFMNNDNLLIIKSGDSNSFNARLCFHRWKYLLTKQHISFFSFKALSYFCTKNKFIIIDFYKLKHVYGGIHPYKLIKNIIKYFLIKTNLDNFLKRHSLIELANDHFIAVIKKD